jgi:DNA-binding transcriptional MerR regulator
MRIGELAKRTGTTARTLRFYESQGLLESRRTANGYRDYRDEDLRLINEIRTLQTLGLTLDETRPFIECLRAGNEYADVCPNSIEVYRRRLTDLDLCIERLSGMRADLAGRLDEALTRRKEGASCQEC